VVRCFDDTSVIHVDGSVAPRRDIEVVEAELIFKDLDTVERKLAEAQKRAKAGEKKSKSEAELFARVRTHLLSGRLVRSLATRTDEERLWLRDLHLLTNKPVMYVCNVHENEIAGENAYVRQVREYAGIEGAPVVTVSAAVEAEVADLPPGERDGFLKGLGLEEAGLNKVVHEGYLLLALITFFTGGPNEVRAWTVSRGTNAPAAAGAVHSDFERGFIRAEIINYEDLERLGSVQAVREAGFLHIEGREYVMKEGDIAHFRFNV
jgi:GTP-binding protein YchF